MNKEELNRTQLVGIMILLIGTVLVQVFAEDGKYWKCFIVFERYDNNTVTIYKNQSVDTNFNATDSQQICFD